MERRDGREVKKITEFHSEAVIAPTYYAKKKAIFHDSNHQGFSWLAL